MCFSKPASPKAPPPPPTERAGDIAGAQERQRQAAAAANSGFQATVGTSPLGDTSAAPVVKKKLGQ